MFNKIVSIKHNYTMPNISNDMSITTFGDLHYCSSFDDKRLNLLTEYLFNNDSKYLFIVGDIIDSTDFLHNDEKKENKDYLLNFLDENLNYLDNLDNSKVKVLVCHSPIYMSDKDVMDRVKEYDFIFSGHMHNGMIPYPFDKIKVNTGIIAPNKSLFPDNARGTKDINVGDKDIHLIINGGITKLSECTNVLSKFNNIYKMNIDEIEINSKVKKLVK